MNLQGAAAKPLSTFVAGRGLENESAAALVVKINTARDYANWGGEFMDDAFRFWEQPFQVTDESRFRET